MIPNVSIVCVAVPRGQWTASTDSATAKHTVVHIMKQFY